MHINKEEERQRDREKEEEKGGARATSFNIS